MSESALYQLNRNRHQPWNELPLLPIAHELHYTTEIMEKLGQAKAALGRLQGRSVVIPNQGILINTISLQEAKLSSAVENIFTTDDELYKAYSDHANEAKGASKEVVRYREALWKGYYYLKEKETFDLAYFIQVFQEVKQNSEGFRPDFVNTTIRQSGSGPDAGRVIYTPPRGQEILATLMENLLTFINDDAHFRMDHLIKMAVAHYQFEAIHPFRDGNGRTGRIFNIHYLTAKGLLEVPILFMSRYILDNKEDYYHALQGVSQRGNWRDWLMFMLTAVERTSSLTYHKINEIVAARDSILHHVKKTRQFRNAEDLVQAIFTQPYTKTKHLVTSGLYAENTARAYLNQMSEMGILEKREVDGKHYYLNLELHRILSD